jgi:hypothetical protein
LNPLSPEQRWKGRSDALKETKAAMSDVQRIHAKYVAGRPGNEILTDPEAVQAAKVLYGALRSDMREALKKQGKELSESDVRVGIVYTDRSLTTAYMRKYVPGRESEIQTEFSGKPIYLLGLIFGIVDPNAKDPSQNLIVGIKTFHFSKRVIGILKEVAENEAEHNGLN